MAYNYEYPYTDPYRYNDDWILNYMKRFESLPAKIDTIIKNMGINFTTWADFEFPEAYGAVGNGVSDDTMALLQACNSGKPILLWQKYALSNINITSKTVFVGGMVLCNGYVTFSRDICADISHIITVAGGECHISNGIAYPEWFGAVGDGATDDTEAMQNALDNGNVILSIGKIYLISKTLTMTVGGSSLTSFKNNSRFGYIKSSSEFNGKSIIEITAPQCTIQGITFFGNKSLISITSKLVKTNESSYYLSDNDVTIIGNRFVNNKCISHYGRGLHCENNIFENPTDNAIDIYGTEDSESSIMQLMTQYGGRAIKILNNRMHAPTGSKYLVHFHNDVSCQWYGVVIIGNLMDLSGSLIRSDCKLINTLICENSVNMNYWQTPDIYLSDCESVNINNNILCGREKECTSGYLHNNSIFICGKFINSEITNNVIANTGDAPIRSTSDITNSIISNNKVRYASIINSQFLVYSDGTISNSFIDKNIIDDNSKCLKVVNCNTISNLWLGKNYGIEHLIPFGTTSGTYTDVEYISSTGVLTVANS